MGTSSAQKVAPLLSRQGGRQPAPRAETELRTRQSWAKWQNLQAGRTSQVTGAQPAALYC